jgi:hypothetical protein
MQRTSAINRVGGSHDRGGAPAGTLWRTSALNAECWPVSRRRGHQHPRPVEAPAVRQGRVIVEDGVGLRPRQSEVHPVALTLASLLDLYLKVTEAASLRTDVRICFN